MGFNAQKPTIDGEKPTIELAVEEASFNKIAKDNLLKFVRGVELDEFFGDAESVCSEAYASILHLPKAELKAILKKMAQTIKRGGIIYTSFKYENSSHPFPNR